MIFNYIWFGGLVLAIVGSAIGLLFSRNAIYSALFLVFNFSVVAVLYLMLGAPFLAMAQVSVYAGAIMVLFLFVIMLLGGEQLPGKEPMKFQRVLAIGLAAIFFVEAGLLVAWKLGAIQGGLTILPAATADYGSPKAVGSELFTKYALPFEITSVILLAAAVGAITLTRGEGVVSIRKVLLRSRRIEMDEEQQAAEQEKRGG